MLPEHQNETGHDILFDSISALAKASFYIIRKVQENNEICCHPSFSLPPLGFDEASSLCRIPYSRPNDAPYKSGKNVDSSFKKRRVHFSAVMRHIDLDFIFGESHNVSKYTMYGFLSHKCF